MEFYAHSSFLNSGYCNTQFIFQLFLYNYKGIVSGYRLWFVVVLVGVWARDEAIMSLHI